VPAFWPHQDILDTTGATVIDLQSGAAAAEQQMTKGAFGLFDLKSS